MKKIIFIIFIFLTGSLAFAHCGTCGVGDDSHTTEEHDDNTQGHEVTENIDSTENTDSTENEPTTEPEENN